MSSAKLEIAQYNFSRFADVARIEGKLREGIIHRIMNAKPHLSTDRLRHGSAEGKILVKELGCCLCILALDELKNFSYGFYLVSL